MTPNEFYDTLSALTSGLAMKTGPQALDDHQQRHRTSYSALSPTLFGKNDR